MAVNISQDDIKIFLILQEFPCLPVQFIGELWGEQPIVKHHENGKVEVRYQWIRKRLATLRDAGYLRWPDNTRPRLGQINRSAVYALTAKGREELERRGLSKPIMRLSNNVQHDLGASMVVASFKLGMMAHGLRYITPQEFLDRPKCPPETRDSDSPFVIPCPYWYRGKYVEYTKDGEPVRKKHDWHPFGIGYTHPDGWETKLYLPGIEFDRDSEGNSSSSPDRPSIERHLSKAIALYDEWYRKHYGTRALYLPIVTTGAVERWTSTLLKITDGQGHDHILFRHMPDWEIDSIYPKADGHMLMGDWQRAGYEPFNTYKELTKEKSAGFPTLDVAR